MSNSLQPHELQHARPPCPSPTPRLHSDSCPLSQRCHPAISSSVIPFSFSPKSSHPCPLAQSPKEYSIHLHHRLKFSFLVIFLLRGNRDITLPTKVHLVKAMVFPVVMYGCKNWTVKKAERRRIDAFELWCWRRFLRVPCTARRSNQSILKEISPGCSLEGMITKAETPVLWPPHAKS